MHTLIRSVDEVNARASAWDGDGVAHPHLRVERLDTACDRGVWGRGDTATRGTAPVSVRAVEVAPAMGFELASATGLPPYTAARAWVM
jgi:hypothetical protein